MFKWIVVRGTKKAWRPIPITQDAGGDKECSVTLATSQHVLRPCLRVSEEDATAEAKISDAGSEAKKLELLLEARKGNEIYSLPRTPRRNPTPVPRLNF